MSDYAVYDEATGKVLRSGTCPPTMVSVQAQEGQAAVLLKDGAQSEVALMEDCEYSDLFANDLLLEN